MRLTIRNAGNVVAGATLGLGAIGLVLGLFLVGPWLLFWSVGALTGFSIPLTLKTWLAAVVFLSLVRGGGSSK